MKNIAQFFYLAKFFGLAPYVLNGSRDEKDKKIRSRRFPTFMMISIYSLCVCSIFWKNKAVSEISYTANWIQFIPNAAIFFIVLVAADRSRYTIQSISHLIHDLDQKLHAFQISYVSSSRRIKRLSIFATCCVVFCGSNIAIWHYIIGVTSELSSKFYWLSFVLAKIGLLTFNFMFALYMTVLLERLRILDKAIQWMVELPSSKKVDNQELCKNILRMNALSNIIIPQTTMVNIADNIYEIVEILQKICSKMNSYFGKKVIFTILSAFICLTVQLFYLINNIRHGLQNERAVLGSMASCSLIFTHILELWVIFISGHRVKDMYAFLIRQIQTTKRKFSNDEIFKSKIDELVQVMAFTRVEIKAAGLFNIDLSVICSIVSSIATYLVVLLQFKLTEEEAKNSTSLNDTSQFAQFGILNKDNPSATVLKS